MSMVFCKIPVTWKSWKSVQLWYCQEHGCKCNMTVLDKKEIKASCFDWWFLIIIPWAPEIEMCGFDFSIRLKHFPALQRKQRVGCWWGRQPRCFSKNIIILNATRWCQQPGERRAGCSRGNRPDFRLGGLVKHGSRDLSLLLVEDFSSNLFQLFLKYFSCFCAALQWPILGFSSGCCRAVGIPSKM